MKSFGDLSWREKCKLRDGEAKEYKYSSGYTFDVKQKSKKAKEKAQHIKQQKNYSQLNK